MSFGKADLGNKQGEIKFIFSVKILLLGCGNITITGFPRNILSKLIFLLPREVSSFGRNIFMLCYLFKKFYITPKYSHKNLIMW